MREMKRLPVPSGEYGRGGALRARAFVRATRGGGPLGVQSVHAHTQNAAKLAAGAAF